MGLIKVVFASDHAAVDFKKILMQAAASSGFEVISAGSETGEPVDYPEVVREASVLFHQLEAQFLILLCGSGIGVSIAANRDRRIRGVVALEPEQARMARLHNHANCLCMGSRFITAERGIEILNTFLQTEADTSERHVRRVKMLGEL